MTHGPQSMVRIEGPMITHIRLGRDGRGLGVRLSMRSGLLEGGDKRACLSKQP